MPVALDVATDGGNNSGSSASHTFSHTCTGADLMLLVGLSGDASTGVDDVTGATYNGVAMTLVAKKSPPAGYRWTYLFHLEGPATGAHNVVVSATTAHYLMCGAISYTGVKATAQPDNSTTNVVSAASSLTTSLTPVADSCRMMLLEGGYDGDTSHPLAGTGATRRKNDAAFGAWGLFDNNASISPAASTSMQTTRTGSVGISHIVATFAPATSPPPPGVYQRRTSGGLGTRTGSRQVA